MARQTAPRPARLPVLALTGLALALAACGADRPVATGSLYPADVRERHPITLTNAPQTLDVFANAPGGLDARQYDDVRTFAADYRRHGRGIIAVQVPSGPRGDVATAGIVEAIRRALADGGVPGAPLSVSTYRPKDPVAASPVRLTFAKLQAKVASQCGLWPQDLGVTDVGFNIRNEPHWNLGCAMQSNVAAQVADPVDLVRGRSDGPADTVRRANNIDKLRKAQDPSTNYRQDGQGRINQQVGN